MPPGGSGEGDGSSWLLQLQMARPVVRVYHKCMHWHVKQPGTGQVGVCGRGIKVAGVMALCAFVGAVYLRWLGLVCDVGWNGIYAGAGVKV